MRSEEIMAAARDALKALKNYPVYFDNVKEGMKTPCFFVKLVDVAHQESRGLVYHDCTLHITFFSKKYQMEPIKLYALKDDLVGAFVQGLKVGTRYLKFSDCNSSLEGEDADLVLLDMPFTYYEHIDEKKPEYLMEKLHVVER